MLVLNDADRALRSACVNESWSIAGQFDALTEVGSVKQGNAEYLRGFDSLKVSCP